MAPAKDRNEQREKEKKKKRKEKYRKGKQRPVFRSIETRVILHRAGTIVEERWRNGKRYPRVSTRGVWRGGAEGGGLRNCNSVAFKRSFCGDCYRFDYSTAVFTVLSARSQGAKLPDETRKTS